MERTRDFSQTFCTELHSIANFRPHDLCSYAFVGGYVWHDCLEPLTKWESWLEPSQRITIGYSEWLFGVKVAWCRERIFCGDSWISILSCMMPVALIAEIFSYMWVPYNWSFLLKRDEENDKWTTKMES